MKAAQIVIVQINTQSKLPLVLKKKEHIKATIEAIIELNETYLEIINTKIKLVKIIKKRKGL